MAVQEHFNFLLFSTRQIKSSGYFSLCLQQKPYGYEPEFITVKKLVEA